MLIHEALSVTEVGVRYYNKIDPSLNLTRELARKKFRWLLISGSVNKKVALEVVNEIFSEQKKLIINE